MLVKTMLATNTIHNLHLYMLLNVSGFDYETFCGTKIVFK